MPVAPRRLFASAAALAALVSAAPARAQFCPSYATCRTAPARALNPEPAALSALFDRMAEGPRRYGAAGWAFTTTLTDGCGLPTPEREVDAVFPCVLLKAIALTESASWRQFCVPTAPSPGVASQTLIRSDCGYGLMGISRGMHPGDTSAFDPARVASDPGYNISVGEGLLADAWRAMPCIGDRRVRVIEDWYFAVWAYGGLSYSSNPSNPMYRADRAPYRDPTGLPSSEYPYQEVVFGWIRNPPSADHYAPVRVTSRVAARSAERAAAPTPTHATPTRFTRATARATPRTPGLTLRARTFRATPGATPWWWTQRATCPARTHRRRTFRATTRPTTWRPRRRRSLPAGAGAPRAPCADLLASRWPSRWGCFFPSPDAQVLIA